MSYIGTFCQKQGIYYVEQFSSQIYSSAHKNHNMHSTCRYLRADQQEYFYQKQTLKQLSHKYQHSIPWIRKHISEYEPSYQTYAPRTVTVVADATFCKKRTKSATLRVCIWPPLSLNIRPLLPGERDFILG